MSDLDKNLAETSLNQSDSFSYGSPSRAQRDPSSRVLESAQKQLNSIKIKELQEMLKRVGESQMQGIELAHKIIRQDNLRFKIGLPIGFLIVLALCLFVSFQKLNKLEIRISQLEHLSKITKQDIRQLHELIRRHKDYLQELQLTFEDVKEQIYDIHMNEMIKQEKSIHIFQKYSTHFSFTVDQEIKQLKKNYNINIPKIRKKSEEVSMLFSAESIPQTGIHFMQIKVVQTLYGMISFGVIPASKRSQDCVYCDSSDIFYIYCQNGNIYNGQYLNLNFDMLQKSRKTRFQKITNGDVITMFVDSNEKVVVWYVNNRYAGSESLKDIQQAVYPFIEMTSRGDQIIIMK